MSTSSYIIGSTQGEGEIFYSTYEPTNEEIIEYAVKIGIDPEKETSIIYLARQGLLHPLPDNWKPCYSKQVKAYYYYDRITKKSQWEHPIDVLYRAKVIDARKGLICDQSDSTSFGDSGFRSLKSNNNHENLNQLCVKDPPGNVTDYKSNEVKNVNCSNGDLVLKNVHSNFATMLTTHIHQEGVSNKENNSQDKKVKNNNGFESDMDFSKKISFNIGHDTKTEAHELVKNVDYSNTVAHHSFTITGTGTRFLKSNKKLDIETQDSVRKRESEMKGILRDTSLTYVRSKGSTNDDSGNEERKSVRFDIDTNKSLNESNIDKDVIGVIELAFDSKNAARNDDDEDDNDDNDKNDNDDDDDHNDKNDNKDEIIDCHSHVEERFKHQELPVPDQDLNATRVTPSSSSETSEQNSEILTGIGLTNHDKEVKVCSAVVSMAIPESNDLLDECDVDSLQSLNQSIINQERERYSAKLEEELRSLAEREEIKMQNELQKTRNRYNTLLVKEKQRLKDMHQQNINEIKEFYQVKLNEMKSDYEAENTKEYAVFQETLQEEFDRLVKEVTDSHRTTMATLQKNHDEIVEELERDLKMEEDLLKKEHSTKLSEIKIKLGYELEMERQRMRETGENRLYEKVRCEKRLLEDKYKCLKEKYTRLKTDVRISLDRRKKRREQQQQQQHSLLSNSYETDDRTNSKPLPSHSYEIEKRESGSSSNALVKSEKLTPSNLQYPIAAPKRCFALDENYTTNSKHSMPNISDNGSVDPIKSPCVLHHFSNNNNNRNNNNNNNNHKHHIEGLKLSKTKYLQHNFLVNNIFTSIQHEDNFSSDSEFHQMNFDNKEVDNSCSSTQAGAALSRPKRKIFTKTKSSSTSKLNSTKHEREISARPCTPVENLRIQLKKLEELEDQIPDCNIDATYHLRYPFINNINNVENSDTNACIHGETSRKATGTDTDRSELEFFKHRILLERDSVIRAKESLRTQKKIFKSKQHDVAVKHAMQNKQTMDQICQEEKELTEMEVSLHRTRALLGEKVIRLKHLENSLNKLSEKDHPMRHSPRDIHLKPKETLSDLSSYSSSGFSSTDVPTTEHHYGHLQVKQTSTNVDATDTLLHLKHLHTEIREIWSLLNPTNAIATMEFDEIDFLNNDATEVHPKQLGDAILLSNSTASTCMTTTMHAIGQHSNSSKINNQHHYTLTLLEKTRDLKNWLRQAKTEHDLLKKQSFTFSETNTQV
ncbi:uncharacterized protein MAL13P1.304 isoform X1 [Anopheles gambiae]|uniref:uncharacterized protein MAL13P1.304 isoform X1 n=1 Tax=Anopheles gambiae TaxID=7165 RepID=UPI002AC95709|nr:uncharacterized protein MAL13P1.304 isoform X1 [Anopheles gambiae]XP_061507749.1 uncharacterized protein MAL13P1.304 isoform X1 [Anopheles gambiae]XP_061507750.1 uncharacterized protein MAL13P1.304 isoform X1 [Anopheles gambiae]